MTVKLSVCIITFNHERFIAQALESVLMQETDFEFEIVVGDDHSTDHTPEILESFRQRNPDKIRLILRESNISAGRNLEDTYHRCRGEYIALLDGDDYWTCPHKLQKQVDFLDRHPDFAMSGHRVEFVYDDEDREVFEELYPNREKLSRIYKEVGTLRDAIEDKMLLPTRSRVSRKAALQEFPDWYFDVLTGDTAQQVLIAQHGLLGFMKDVMAAHRIHAGGIYSQTAREERILDRIRSLRYYGKHLGRSYRWIILFQLSKAYLPLSDCYARKGQKLRVGWLLLRSGLIQLALLRLPRGCLSRALALIGFRSPDGTRPNPQHLPENRP